MATVLKTVDVVPVSLATVAARARVAEIQRTQDWLGWCKLVEEFATASGVRCLLEHVGPADWRNHYENNEDPQNAVLLELRRADC